MTKPAPPLEADSCAGEPGFPLGEPGEVVIHAGPRQSPRIVSVPTAYTDRLIDLAAGADLFDAVTGLLDSLDVQGVMAEFVDGEFGRVNFVHPTYGADAEHPMSFSSEFHIAGPATLHRASATVGSKDGAPFSHIHASWVAEEGLVKGGHLLPGTLVGPRGIRLRVFGLNDAQLLSESDPETGFSAFAPAPVGAAPPQFDAVISRVRPGELIDEAIMSVCRGAGFDSAKVGSSLGSTTGAVFTDRTAPWPAVEFTHLSGSVSGALGESPLVRIEGEVVDVAGDVRSGVLAARANPVAVTFELLVRRA